MSEDLVHQITVDCLINKEVYLKMQKSSLMHSINKKEKKFYRKRVLNLTRELLLKKDTSYNEINPDIKNSFDNFVKTCIHYFKTIDRNDIIQEEYNHFDDDPDNNDNEKCSDTTNLNDYNNENNNKLFMRSIKIKNGLENFVTIKSFKKPDEMILPKIKDINLEEPTLRNKGIIKKENITIKYDETNIQNENKDKKNIQKK
jgi:hypothetical protein